MGYLEHSAYLMVYDIMDYYIYYIVVHDNRYKKYFYDRIEIDEG